MQGALLIALQREDVVLPGDLALRKAIQAVYQLDHLPSQQEVLAIAEKWRPYRSLATSYLFSAAFEPTEAPPEGTTWLGTRLSCRTNRARTGIGVTSTSSCLNSRVPRRHRCTREGLGRTDVDVRLRRPAGHAGRRPGGHAGLPRRVRYP